MRTAALLATVALVANVTAAGAFDLSVRSSLSQSIDINNNYQLRPVSPGPTYVPISTLFLGALLRNHTTKIAASGNLSYRDYLGPGAENLTAGLDRNFQASIDKQRPGTNYHLDAGFSTRQSNQIQLEETGESTLRGDTTISWVGGEIRRQLGYLDQVTVSSRATRTSGTVESQDVTVTGSWIHRLSTLTEIIPTFQYQTRTTEQRTDLANSTGSASNLDIWRGTLGLSTRLTKRLSFSATAGVVVLSSDSGANLASGNALLGLSGASGGTVVDWIGDLSLTYQVNTTDTFNLKAARTIGPDTFSTVREFDTVGAVYRHRINRAASVALVADFSYQPSTTTTTQLFSTGVLFDYRLAREWYTSASYRYRQRTGGGGNADSHGVFATIRRDVQLFGDPGDSGPEAAEADISRLLSWPGAWMIRR